MTFMFSYSYADFLIKEVTIKKGDNRFRRYSWKLKSDLLTVLIQYVGDETIQTE